MHSAQNLLMPTAITNDRWHESFLARRRPLFPMGQPGARYQPPKPLDESTISAVGISLMGASLKGGPDAPGQERRGGRLAFAGLGAERRTGWGTGVRPARGQTPATGRQAAPERRA